MRDSSSSPLPTAFSSLKPVFFYLMFFSFVSNIFMLAIPLYSLQVLDRVITSGSMETLFWLTAITLAIMAAATIIQVARSGVMQRVNLWLDQVMQDSLVKRTIQLSAVAANGAQPCSQMMRDFNTVKSFLTGSFAMVLLDAPWSAFYFLAVMIIHPLIGAVTFAGSVLLILLAWLNERAMRAPLMRANTLSVHAMQALEAAARNAEAIDAMGMTEPVAARLRHKNDAASHWHMLANRRSNMIQSISRYTRIVLQVMVTCTGAYLATHQEITTGAIIASSILANKAMAPFENIVAMWKTIGDARIALHRLATALELFPEAEERTVLPEPMGRVDVERLTYGVANKIVLRDINFSLKIGESLCIIGPSAAGKSTLVRLLAGVTQPLAGSVRLDGAEMKHWRRDQALEYIGYLPQDVELFEGSVRDNIARMREGVEDTKVIAAAKMAGVHEMILQLPQSYETDIGHRGMHLSQGQRQRIGLARAFFGRPRLVMLDEPNANLDQEGEQALLATLLRAREQEITTVTVTHSMSVLSTADKILLLNQGMATRFGPAKEILYQLQTANNKSLQRSA
jgi:PrtD family type I secretion system ABC transporter